MMRDSGLCISPRESWVSLANGVVDVVGPFEYHNDELDGRLEASKGGAHGYDPFGERFSAV